MQRSNKCQTFIPPSEIGNIGGAAHQLEDVLELRIAAYQGDGAYEADGEYAHLTVVSRNVYTD